MMVKQLLYWLPRILSILYIAFISVFALDVFEKPQWLLALLMHLIPSLVLIISTIIAWKNEQLGGFIFIAIGLFMLIFLHFKSLVISIPAIILGVLFLSIRHLSKS